MGKPSNSRKGCSVPELASNFPPREPVRAPEFPISNSPCCLKIAVGIATRNRSSILAEMLEGLGGQTRTPDSIVVAYAEANDIGDAASRFPRVRFLQSATAGLTGQRNAILNASCGEDLILFLDDDFCLEQHYVAVMEQAFLRHPDVCVATGLVRADGIGGPGYSFAEAQAILDADTPASGIDRGSGCELLTPVFNAYGCNMVVRLAPVRLHALRFNEELPLYGWYEDVEFSRQMASFGEVVRVEGARGVHLGVKSGRQSGLRLGYSQVANPVYLARRRSVPWTYAIASMLSRSLKNLAMCVSPEPLIDRRGRLQGNLRAWGELLRGQIHPTRIMEL